MAVASYNSLQAPTRDAEGTRIAKGSISAWSCDPVVSGFQTVTDYVLGTGGEQVTEMGVDANGTLNWAHTNVWAGGKLLATYDGATGVGKEHGTSSYGLHFYFDDSLGTRRVQTDFAGKLEQSCQTLPYGDTPNGTGVTCSPAASEHTFTGKERDTESGNDYFDARYYSSAMGRFMSPDWSAKEEPVPYAKLGNPQTLNLYAYLMNNPLAGVDADGHCSGDVAACSRMCQDGRPCAQAPSGSTPAPPPPAQKQTLPKDPSGLGEGWKDVTPQGGKNPKIPKRFQGPKGTEIEFDPGEAGKPGWGGKDHWHGIGPDGKREGGHLAPGAPIPGPDGVPEPEPAPQAPGPSNSPFSDWVHDQWQGFKNYLRDHPYGPNSSPGPYVPPLVPIPVPLIP